MRSAECGIKAPRRASILAYSAFRIPHSTFRIRKGRMSCWLTSRKSLLSYMPESRTSGGIFDIAGKEARAAELDALTTTQEFWQAQEKAQAILKERATLTDVIAQWKKQARKLAH